MIYNLYVYCANALYGYIYVEIIDVTNPDPIVHHAAHNNNNNDSKIYEWYNIMYCVRPWAK